MSNSPKSNFDDLPDWMISLSRQLVRDCRAPGEYQISFTVDDHHRRIHTAVISRVETIRIMPHERNRVT